MVSTPMMVGSNISMIRVSGLSGLSVSPIFYVPVALFGLAVFALIIVDMFNGNDRLSLDRIGLVMKILPFAIGWAFLGILLAK